MLEPLEPRLLFSADAASLLATYDVVSSPAEPAVDILHSSQLNSIANSAVADTHPALAGSELELVIVDRAVEDADWIAKRLATEQGAERIVVFIDTSSDGIDQISRIMETHENVSRVLLFSHGSDAQLQLGTTNLDMNELLQRAEQISRWSSSLSQGADILIYGCDLVTSADGEAFATLLGELTRANIAASDDLTGSADLGGDWTLEFTTGVIDAEPQDAAAILQDYTGVFATFTVTTADDNVAGSLRQAIEDANNAGGANQIVFTTAVTEPIKPTSELPVITSQLEIDGENRIVLDGSLAGNSTGLKLGSNSDYSVISNIQIIHFAGDGIALTDAENVSLIHNYIGTDGTDNRGNTGRGIVVTDSPNTAIGNGLITGSNVIAGNGGHGILLTGVDTYATNIEYNFIGTNESGTAAIANGQSGILISNSANWSTVHANIISGNGSNGVSISGYYTIDNILTANRIGTTADGSSALGNQGSGISLYNEAFGNTVGGSAADSANLVSGNAYDGISISGAGTDFNDVLGNLIGTNLDGTSALGNNRHGVQISYGAQNNFIGGSGIHERNIISGNVQTGVTIDGNDSYATSDNHVIGNYIGTDITGTSGIANEMIGIYVKRGASDNVIGGVNDDTGSYTLLEGNVISGNGDFSDPSNPSGSGIRIQDISTNGNRVFGNFIGTQADGASLLGNAQNGIEIYYGPQNSRIGDADITLANVISGNGLNGIKIDSFNATTHNNLIVGNRIGTDITATLAIGNGDTGIYVNNGSSDNTIGGDRTAGYANIIVANLYGIKLGSEGTDNNIITGNYIGTNADDSSSLGNSVDGIVISGKASNNRVGGPGNGQGNIISGNAGNGIQINGDGTDSNVVQGNFIGSSSNGSGANGNGASGVRIVSGATNSLIGGSSAAGEGNLVSGNLYAGVSFWGPGTDGHSIQGNRIGTSLDGNSTLGAQSVGILLQGGASNNTIGGISTSGTGNLISGHTTGHGIRLVGSTTSNNIITGNLIGTNATGDAVLSNETGIYINGASNTRIGGPLAGEENIIAGNTGIGIDLHNADTSATVQGNYIGTNSAGSQSIGNGNYGIYVKGSTQLVTIGGAAAEEGNIISGNATYGLSISDTVNVIVKGNYIGVDDSGFEDIGNATGGIRLSGTASHTQIGGAANGEGNVVSGNLGSAITLDNDADSNTISGNLIGLAIDGITLMGNLGYGIAINTSNNRIGGSTTNERNIIAANTSHGIAVLSAADENTILGNIVGTDASKTIDAGNNGHGIWLQSYNNHLGGTLPGSGNIIAFNNGNGIRIEDGVTGNSLLGNAIWDNGGIGIDLDGDSLSANDTDDTDTGANNVQNFPVLGSVIINESGSLSLDGRIQSNANTTYRVEYFASTNGDPSGHGGAERMIGYSSITTDASGSAEFHVVLDASVSAGEYITATATVDNGSAGFSDTSEYAANVVAVSHDVDNSAPTFSAGEGVHTVELATLYNGAVDMATQADGKYLVLSAVNTAASGLDMDFALTRFTADGSLDTSFGTGGTIINALTTGNETVSALSIQGDGKIILAGAQDIGNENEAVMIRYNLDGTLDTTFGTGGVAAFSISGTTSSVIKDIELLPDGRIMASGYAKVANVDTMLAIRTTIDGNLDTSFDGNGYKIIDTGAGEAKANALQVQTDGKVVIAGYRNNATTLEARIVRLNVDGTLDTTFSSDGHIILRTADNLHATTLAIADDGTIVVGGNSDATGFPSQISRFLTDGSLDSSFGGTGYVTINVGSPNESVNKLIIQEDGRIVVTGNAYNGSNYDLSVFRLNTDGTLDNGFGGDGTVRIDLNGATDSVAAVDIDAMGNIMVAGDSDGNMFIASINDSGLVNGQFNAANTLDATPAYTEDAAAIVLDADVTVYDRELSEADNFSGASLTLVRDSLASVDDIFGFTDGEGLSLVGSHIFKGGQVIASFDGSSMPGQLTITFTDGNGEIPTNADVNHTLRQITYQNGSDNPPSDVQINWTLTDGNTGSQGIGNNRSVTGHTIVSLTAVNDAPVITSNGAGATASLSVNEGVTGVAVIEAEDVDADTVLTYDIAGGADAGSFDIGSSSGELSFLAAPDHESKSSYEVLVSVSDDDGKLDTQLITVTINDLNEAATFDTSAALPDATEDSVYTVFINTSDPDTGDTRAFSSIDLPGWLTLLDNNDGTATLSGTPLQTDIGFANFTLEIEDADGLKSTRVFSLTVQNVNDPALFTSASAFTVAENGTVAAQITSSDEDDDDPEYAIAGGNDAVLFSIDADSGELTFNSAPDFENPQDADGNNIYEVAISVTDNVGPPYSQAVNTITITVQDLADEDLSPITDTDITAGSDGVIDENSAIGSTVGITANTVDGDAGQTVSYALSGTDAALFSIDANGVVTTTAVLDHETADERSFTVTATSSDGSTATRDFTVTVSDLPDEDLSPITDTDITAGSDGIIDENSATGSTVGITANSVDGDDGQTIAYALSGTDAALFSIDANGVVTTTAVLDHETADERSFTVTATSSDGSTATRDFTVTVSDLPDEDLSPITDTDITAGSDGIIDENSATGSTVGITANTVDGDAGQTISYALSGADASLFSIDSDGIITTAAVLDHEAAGERNFTVTATSSDGSTATRDFSVSVTDLPDEDLSPITDTNLTAGSDGIIDENSATGSTVGITANSVDGDDGQTISYALSGADAALFSIDSDGIITTAAVLDHETADERSFTVTATSSDGSTATRDFTVTVSDLADEDLSPITDTDLTAGSDGVIDENSAIGSTVGISANTVDGDAGQTISYALSGTDAALFSIDANGVVTTTAVLDHETADERSFTVTATSSDGSTATRDFTVTVSDLPDEDLSPITDTDITAGSDGIIDENSATGSTVGITANSVDGDDGQTIAYALSGTDAALFSIDANGVVTTTAVLDHETADERSFTVTATSSDGSTATRDFTVTVSDLADEDLSPITDTDITAGSDGIIDENSAVGSTVGITANTADGDDGQTISYALSGADAALFSIDSDGIITTAAVLDHETADERSFTVTATSSDGSTATRDLTVTVTDLADEDLSPITDTDITAGSDGIIDENSAVGSTVGITANTVDGDAGQTISYALSGADAALFSIDSDGIITTAAVLDHETADERGFTVTATSSDGSTATRDFTVTVTDLADEDLSPITDTDAIAGNNGIIDENSAIGSTVGITANTVDGDDGQTIAYTLSGTDAALFSIDANGVVTTTAALDHETADERNFTVTATSSDGSTATRDFSVTVIDLADEDLSPITDTDITAGSDGVIDENSAIGSTVGITAHSVDGDAGQTVSYALSGADAALFNIDANGIVTTAAVLDHEAADQYSFTVTATSSDGSIASRIFTVDVGDINEGPSFITDGALPDATEDLVYSVTIQTSDPDSGDTHTIQSADLPAWLTLIDNNDGTATLRGTPQQLDNGPATFTISIEDAADLSSTRTFSLTVNNVNDAPTITSDSALTIAENIDGVATITALDADGESLTYSIAGGNDAALFSINPTTGYLRFSTVPDYENPLDADADHAHELIIRVDDGTGSPDAIVTQAIKVTVTDLPDEDLSPITDLDTISGSEGIIDENSAVGSTVGIQANTVDGDAGQSISYALSGNDAALFSIDTNGIVTTAASLDHEAADQRSFTVTATSSDGSIASRMFTVAVGDTNEGPSFITDGALPDATEDAVYSGTIRTSDPDSGDTHTINSFDLPAWLTLIDNGDGTATLRGTPQQLDNGSATFTLHIEDAAGLSSNRTFSLTVNNVNDAPIIISDSALTIAENIYGVATITALDADGESLTYSIAGGNDAALFSINPTTGYLRFSTVPDYENPLDADADHVHELIIRVDDGTGSPDAIVTQAIKVTVTDLPDEDLSPITDLDTLAGSDGIVDENSTIGSTVGIIANAIDGDAGQTVAYTLSGTDAALFSIDTNGVVTTAAILDHEAAEKRSFIVTAISSDGSSTSRVFTLAVSDVNEAPTINIRDIQIKPDQDGEIGTLNIVDPDSGDTVELTIVGGNAASSFIYDNSTEQLSQITHLDAGSYSLEVRLIDSAGNATEATLTISILDDPRLQAALPDQTMDSGALAEVESTLSGITESVYNRAPEPNLPPKIGSDRPAQEKPAALSNQIDEEDVPPGPATSSVERFNDPIFQDINEDVSVLIENPGNANQAATVEKQGNQAASAEKTRLLALLGDLQKQELTTAQSIIERFQILPFQLSLAPTLFDGDDALTQELSESVREQRQQQQLVVAIGTGASVALTAGFVTWLLKAGVLLSTAKSSAPLWGAIDPVPVLHKEKVS